MVQSKAGEYSGKSERRLMTLLLIATLVCGIGAVHLVGAHRIGMSSLLQWVLSGNDFGLIEWAAQKRG
jgi:hypothetical protein